MLTPSGLELKGYAAAVEQRTGEFRPVVLRGDAVVASDPWRKTRGWDAMFRYADAALRRYVRSPK